jgi:hypothetical protein
MISDDEFRAYALDAREAFSQYETLPTVALEELDKAYARDVREAKTPEAMAWAAGRLALISKVIGDRARTGDGPTVVQ